MLIDFDKIAETHAVDFRGGHGIFDRRIFEDPRVKIMYSTLRPGASTGLHRHEQNCEIMFVVSGEDRPRPAVPRYRGRTPLILECVPLADWPLLRECNVPLENTLQRTENALKPCNHLTHNVLTPYLPM